MRYCLQLLENMFRKIVKPKKDVSFGWRAVFRGYTLRDWMKDSILPSIAAIVVFSLVIFSDVDVFEILKVVVRYATEILSSLVGFVLAAYAILLSLMASDKMQKFLSSDSGNKLATQLNGSFAAILMFSVCGLTYFFAFEIIAELNFHCSCADLINYSALLIAVYVVFFIFYTLVNIIVDLYNCGQVFPTFQEKDGK